MRSILMACNSNKLEFQGKCFAHLIRKNGYFGISSLRTCQHFFTMALPYSACPTHWGPKLYVIVFEYWTSTNITNLQNFIFFPQWNYKKVTFSLSDHPVAFLGSSNFFIQPILNFTVHFLNTASWLVKK